MKGERIGEHGVPGGHCRQETGPSAKSDKEDDSTDPGQPRDGPDAATKKKPMCLAVTVVPFALTDKTAIEDVDLGRGLDRLLLCRCIGSVAWLTRIDEGTYRDRVREERELRRLEAQVRAAQKVAERLDGACACFPCPTRFRHGFSSKLGSAVQRARLGKSR
jgi:hypothetical protein